MGSAIYFPDGVGQSRSDIEVTYNFSESTLGCVRVARMISKSFAWASMTPKRSDLTANRQKLQFIHEIPIQDPQTLQMFVDIQVCQFARQYMKIASSNCFIAELFQSLKSLTLSKKARSSQFST